MQGIKEMRCEERFQGIYKKSSEGIAFCPYRACPTGVHSDHQHGKIKGFVINEENKIVYVPVSANLKLGQLAN